MTAGQPGHTAIPPEPATTTAAPAVVVAVDGGGSKTDAIALALDGRVVARRRGGGSSPHFDGLARSVATIDALVGEVSGGAPVAQANLYLSGLDLDREIGEFRAELAGRSWAGPSTIVANDLFALLRAGTDEPDAVVIVCGTGVNAAGVRADGRVVRFPSLGAISGDWGGGSGLGAEALWHAARHADGRGPATWLTGAMLEQLQLDSVQDLIEEVHFGRRQESSLAAVAPLVFEAARRGDAVGAALVARQAEEIVAFARACLTRLDLLGRPVPIVLGGGILAARDRLLLDPIERGIAELAPRATLTIVEDPPIVGAALLALESAGAGEKALARARAALAG
ncbi:N-acetylglucosamine kinase [Agromyces mediolanus]|uniref:N-acetylglucosamine kinase n=1 Tax=Agromyces mediolanus TaxID=41986 RepID=UPI00203F4413|nr:BadF/BadG/BcrA/BcrD ATPase family protein [Agromyces mediolanus]MCM3655951.1 N-acetylglucosamine kinase [Agromyces mediolanus]